MGDQLTGWLHGNTITLETAAPPLEGKRVRVKIELAEDSEAVLSSEEQARLWQGWFDHGPQGPVELGAGIELPGESGNADFVAERSTWMGALV
jgi:hypothetical protein